MRLLAAAGLLLPTSALAQAYQCRPPDRVDSVQPAEPDGPARRAQIARYTLAASWSPEFCRGDKLSMQCSGHNGRFGFVLHGLWPEARFGPSPQWCARVSPPSTATIRANLCMTPVPALLAHEWAKHGSCMARSPEGYFRVATILWRSLHWPDADRLSRKRDLTAGDLRAEFLLRNSGWRSDNIGLVLGRSGWLREVHLCYGRDFMPQRCPRDAFGPADAAPVKIWRGL